MRIALISDTHMPGALRDLWPQAIDLFQGVDCVLHAGDLHTLEVVDELNRIAPVYVAKGNGDMDIVDPRLQDTWQLEFDGLRIAMIHRFPSPDRKSPALLAAYAERHFGAGVDPHVVIYGHTHLESTHIVDDRLYVNPGSPTLPRNQSLRLGTVGILEVAREARSGRPSAVTASIHQLTRTGADLHDDVSTLTLDLTSRLPPRPATAP